MQMAVGGIQACPIYYADYGERQKDIFIFIAHE